MLARPTVAEATTDQTSGDAGPVADVAHLRPLLERSLGDPRVAVALLDGPVAPHPELAEARIVRVGGGPSTSTETSTEATSTEATSPACAHGTFVAGVLVARRGSGAPGICPGCTLLLRPIFEGPSMPRASAAGVGRAVLESVEAGARVVNLSAEAAGPADPVLDEALAYAARRGVLVIAAAGNSARLGGSAIAGHPAVVPVVATNARGTPLPDATLGVSIGRRGLAAPGELTSLDATGTVRRGSGSSAATAVVAGTVALLWSLFPDASATEVRSALAGRVGRRAVMPPVMDAEAAYRALELLTRRRCR